MSGDPYRGKRLWIVKYADTPGLYSYSPSPEYHVFTARRVAEHAMREIDPGMTSYLYCVELGRPVEERSLDPLPDEDDE